MSAREAGHVGNVGVGRCAGEHAAPWEQGSMIWDSLRDVLKLLRE